MAGRPRVEITKEEFEKLCEIQCTKEEIANWFRCSPDTIENFCHREYNLNFSESYKRYSVNGKKSLRRIQWEMAQKNVTMAIWLGRNWLGQTDKPRESEDDERMVDELKDFDINFIDASKKEGKQ